MKHNISSRPAFWGLFTCLSLAGLLFCYRNFSRVFPLVNINLTMDRNQALDKAKEIASTLHLGPEHYEQAANFEDDNEATTFIELEGGGKEMLTKVIEDSIANPYYWHVRHFEERNPHELDVFFNPDGTTAGFVEKIAEDAYPMSAVSQDKAQKIAEADAATGWKINLTDYKLIEASQEEKPNKRVDHTFVYENTAAPVGPTHYRMTFVVQGDKLTAIKPTLRIPEGFKLRYENMRSANNMIALSANVFMILFYLFACGIGGMLYLYRRKLFFMKYALLWGFIMATLQLLDSLNSIPLFWFYYNTATSQLNFLLQILLSAVMQWGLFTCVLSLVFAVAEGLTRQAFKHHPKFWHVWKPEYAASWQVLGRTLGGYLMTGINLAYVTALYALTTYYLGWWSPSSSLIDPNIVATYMPWFASLARSANAGFMEECLFRALPLASAALLGRYFKRERLFLVVAFIIQAIVFGAAHANYPAQPAYARLVELIIPSFFFGGMYLVYGLLPAIVSHYVYDVVWFALPLFVAKASGSWLNQTLVILGAALPLLIVLVARLRMGAWRNLPAEAYNSAPLTHEETHAHDNNSTTVVHREETYEHYYKLIIPAGALALLLWAGLARFSHDGMNMQNSRESAQEAANSLLKSERIAEKPWTTLNTLRIYNDPESEKQRNFIWRTHGKEGYHSLLNSHIKPTSWLTRFTLFEGDIAKRAEEVNYVFGQDNALVRTRHTLPEAQEGKELTKEEASPIALAALKKYFSIDSNQAVEKSATASKKPNRTDWTFVYQTPAPKGKTIDETRTTVVVANDGVSDIYQHVFVPQEWERNYTHEKTVDGIITIACTLLLALLAMILSNLLSLRFGLLHIHYPTFLVFFVGLLVKSLFQLYNLWPSFSIAFSTGQPYNTQVITTILLTFLKSFAVAGLLSYLMGMLYSIRTYIISAKPFINHVVTGASTGLIFVALSAIFERLAPLTDPVLPDYTPLQAYWPLLSMPLLQATSFIMYVAAALIFFLGIDSITHGWHTRKRLGTLLFWLAGLSFAGISVTTTTAPWILLLSVVYGALFLAAYVFVFHYERIRIIWAVVALFVCMIAQQMAFNAWAGVIPAGLLSIALIVAISIALTWSFFKQQFPIISVSKQS